jgi:hypothetical protein
MKVYFQLNLGYDDYYRRTESLIIGKLDECYDLAKSARYKSKYYEDNFGIAIVPISIIQACINLINK